MKMARNWNSSIGFQRQFGTSMAFEADYIYTKGTRREGHDSQREPRVRPGDGGESSVHNANRAAAAVAGHGRRLDDSAQHALWAATVAADGLHQAHEQPVAGVGDLHAVVASTARRTSRSRGSQIVPFAVQPDLGNEYALAGDDQRHRAVFNGIWEVGRGFQLSGLHYFGAGIRSGNEYGGDLRVAGCRRHRAAASERQPRRAQQLHPAGAEQDGPPRAAAGSARWPPAIDVIAEVVQRVQPAELHRDRPGEQRELREAGVGSVPHRRRSASG